MSADVALFLALAVFNVPLAFFLHGLVSLLVLFFMFCVVGCLRIFCRWPQVL